MSDEFALKVTYIGKPDEERDQLIHDTLEPLGWEWYASGYDFENDERDVSFTMKFEKSKKST